MPHARMGLGFAERMGGPIVLGEVSDLETARQEFHQGHHAERWEEYGDILRHHWQRFERSVLPGDVIRHFTSRLSGQKSQRLFAERGFVIERGSCLIEGVCCKVGADPVKALENRAFGLAIAPKNCPEYVQITMDEPDEEAVGGIEEFMK